MARHVESSWAFFLLLALIFLAGTGLVFSNLIYHTCTGSDLSPPLKESLVSLGHAFIIAAILGATVDTYAKKKLLNEASRDIAEYIAGYPLPDELHPKIIDILGSNLIVRNARLTYEIAAGNGVPEGKVHLQVEWEYDLENLRTAKDTYVHTMHFEKHSLPTIKKMWHLPSTGGGSYSIDNPQLEPIETGEHRVVPREVEILSKRKNHKYTFGFAYLYILPDEYLEYFFFSRPVIDVTLKVKCPPGFEVFATETPIHEADTWRYMGAFLPNEQIVVRWRKKAAREATETVKPV